MGDVIAFRRRRHARASTGSRAASRAKMPAVIPFESAVLVEMTDDHHSAGMRSRCHHLRTAVTGAPTSEASALSDASRVEPGAHNPMTSRKEDTEIGMDFSIGHAVLKSKSHRSLDCNSAKGQYVFMAENSDEAAFLRDFGRIAKAARVAHGHSQATTAGLLGIDQSLLSKFERGTREMGIALAYRISVLYQIDLGALSARPKRKRTAS